MTKPAATSVTKALTSFFNTGDSKVPATQWLAQLKKLSTAEKVELAQEIAALGGVDLVLSEKEQEAWNSMG
jgi:hypothetical protein